MIYKYVVIITLKLHGHCDIAICFLTKDVCFTTNRST